MEPSTVAAAPAPAIPVTVTSDAAPEVSMTLPLLVVSPVDIGRLLRELEEFDEAMLGDKLRKTTTAAEHHKNSLLLDQLVGANKLNVLEKSDRQQLVRFLYEVKSKAPVLHISFSADPELTFIEKLMTWLRREIHPLVLMTVGLQPNIGAGCIIRSTNKHFDFSLRQDFANKRDMLVESITPIIAPKTAVAAGPAAVVAATPVGSPA